MDISNIHQLFLKCTSVSIDTRKIENDSFFVALKGTNFDANTFASEALTKGAAYVMIDNKDYYIDERTILVEDCLSSLQELAKSHRNFLKTPIIALTGSNGKTTTKELINAVLSQKFKTKATLGNLNNHIGVPLTLLSFDKSTEIGIVEMGANHQKEIAFLCEIAQPDYGYITNFGKAHLDGFGGFEGVIAGKSEMYHYLDKNKKITFINLEDPIQVDKSRNLNCISFGLNNPKANCNIQSISADPFVKIEFENATINTHLIGLYNANNCNAAITIGTHFEVPLEDIKKGLENYIPENNRSQLISKDTNQIILDAYNANPSSMAVAIANFIQLENRNKTIILGDMFELGSESKLEHENIANSLQNQNDIDCFFVGKDFYSAQKKRVNFHFFETFEDFSNEIKKTKIQDNTILIKGSRGMALERTLELL